MSSQGSQRNRELHQNDDDIAASFRTIRGYLDGTEPAFAEVDRWVRKELEVRFPVLGAEVEDLCQTVHSRLLVTFRRGSFRHQSSLKTYVVRITRYCAVDHIRRAYRDPLWTSVLEPQFAILKDSPYQSLDSLEKKQLLHQILMLSPPDCRELWRLAFVDQLSYEEIGQRLSIAPGTVKSRMWRCRQKALLQMRRLRARATDTDH